MIGTAKLNGVDPQAWLADVMRRIADHPASQLHELLPWQFGIEAMIPMTRATGRGLGVTAQFHVWLDYLFPNSIGRPVFSLP
jgi:hypothetical protein